MKKNTALTLSFLTLAVTACLCLSSCGHGVSESDPSHSKFDSTDARLFDMTSPNGRKCTVLITDDSSGGVAMSCEEFRQDSDYLPYPLKNRR